jgi:hypothetical protein
MCGSALQSSRSPTLSAIGSVGRVDRGAKISRPASIQNDHDDVSLFPPPMNEITVPRSATSLHVTVTALSRLI